MSHRLLLNTSTMDTEASCKCANKRAKLPRVRLHFDAGAAGPHCGEVLVRGVGIERSGAAGLPAYLAELAQDFAVYLGPRCGADRRTWPTGSCELDDAEQHMYNSTHAHKHTHRHSTDLTQIVPHGPLLILRLPAPSECRCMSQSSATSSQLRHLWQDLMSPAVGSLLRTRRTVEEWPHHSARAEDAWDAW